MKTWDFVDNLGILERCVKSMMGQADVRFMNAREYGSFSMAFSTAS
jgi:hypothetical protein